MSNDIEVMSGGALQAQTRGEIDMQVATAKRYPRSIKAFRDEALSMATLDTETAEACFYALKRDGKSIEGPSVRLAEIVASCWGNLRVEGRVISDDGQFVTAQGTCWDVERNVVIRTEIQRRVTGRDGRRYSADMVAVTGNAAMSIALRNSIFRVVPNAYTNSIYEAARKVAVGDERTLVDRRAKALAWFAKAGATEQRVLEYLSRPSIDDVKLDDLAALQGLRTAIQDGTTTLDQAFARKPEPESAAKPETGMAGLRAKVAKPEPKPATTATPAPEAPPAEAPAQPDAPADVDPEEVCPVCDRHQPKLRGQMDAKHGCYDCNGVRK